MFLMFCKWTRSRSELYVTVPCVTVLKYKHATQQINSNRVMINVCINSSNIRSNHQGYENTTVLSLYRTFFWDDKNSRGKKCAVISLLSTGLLLLFIQKLEVTQKLAHYCYFVSILNS